LQKFQVHIDDTGEHYACTETRSLLEGMVALNRKGIPAGCQNGGCGVCKVAIVSGDYVTRAMSRAHVSEEEERCGQVLACRVKPRSEIHLSVLGAMKKNVCRPGEGGGPLVG